MHIYSYKKAIQLLSYLVITGYYKMSNRYSYMSYWKRVKSI